MTQTLNNPTRMNYYNGLFMQADDFNTDQHYHMEMLRLHSQYLHNESGVFSGLTLQNIKVFDTGTQAYQVQLDVTKGFAQCRLVKIAQCPEQKPGDQEMKLSAGLLLPEDTTVTIPDSISIDPNGETSVYVTIGYQTLHEDYVADKGDKKIHIVEKPLIGFSTQEQSGAFKTCDDGFSYEVITLGRIVVTPAKTPNAEPKYDCRDQVYLLNETISVSKPAQQFITQIGDKHAISSPDPNAILLVGGGIQCSGILKAGRDITTSSGGITAQNDICSKNGGLMAQSDIRSSSGGLSVSKDIQSSGGKLSVSGDIKSSGGGLTVQQDMSTNNGDINVKQGTLTAKNAVITDSLSFGNDPRKNFKLKQGLDIETGDMTLESGNLNILKKGANITGDVQAQDITAKGNLTAREETLLGKTTISGTLHTKNDFQADHNITASGELAVEKNATFSENLTAKNITATGYMTVKENINCTENLTALNITATQGLEVKQNIDAKQNINASGTIQANNLITDDGTIHNELTVKKNLAVAADATIQKNLTANSVTSLSTLTAKDIKLNSGYSTQNGKVVRDFFTFSNMGSATSNAPVYLETNITINTPPGRLFIYRILVEGYSLYSGVINADVAGTVNGKNPTRENKTKILDGFANDYASGAAIYQYINKKGNLVVRLSPQNSYSNTTYQVGLSVSAWFFQEGFPEICVTKALQTQNPL